MRGIRLLIDTPPVQPESPVNILPGDSLSPVAPWRIINIGNSTRVPLMDFVTEIERVLGVEVRKTYLDMQKGDVIETWADCSLLMRLTGYRPETDIGDGVAEFVAWYRDYYRV